MQLTQKKEKQSRLFLTFLDKQTEKKYLEYYNANAILQSKIASSLGILMYLTFIILDYFISAPGEFIIYFITRMIVSFGPLLIANIIAFSPRFNQNTSSLEYFTVFALLSAQCGHYILMYFTSSSPFYDLGVFTILLFFMFGVTRVRFRFSFYIALLFICIFEIIMLLSVKYNFQIISIANFFLTSIAVSAVVSGYTIEYQHRKKFLLLEKITEIGETTEKHKKEIEELIQFTHLINSLSNLDDIFTEISKYIYQEYKIAGSWLFLPDEKKDYLSAFKAYSYIRLSEDKYDYLMNRKIPLKELEGGTLYKTYQRKKPFYLSKIRNLEFAMDKEFVETLEIKGFLYVPLLRKNECVGILGFSNMHHEMKLSKEEIRKISNLCSQIAGSVDSNHLLQEIEKARNKTESLSRLIKSLNETTDLKEIMSIICKYVHDKYGFPYYSLFLLNPKENRLEYTFSKLPEYVSTGDKRKYLQKYGQSLNLEKRDSIHSNAIEKRYPIYIPDTYVAIKTESGKELLNVVKQKSLVTMPIFYENNPIGTIDFFSIESVNLNPEDVSDISLLSEQIAGILKGSILLKQIQEEKEKALELKIEADAQKQNTEELNKLIKSLNEDFNLESIMQKTHQYIKIHYGIMYYGLGVVEKDKEHVLAIDSIMPDFVSEEDKVYVKQFSTKIKDVIGGHAYAFKAQRPMYTPRIRKSGLTPEELTLHEILKFESFLIIPLILQNNPIGFLDLYNVGKMELSREDITNLSILGEQLAGIIYGSRLLKEVQEEKEKANLAKVEAENAKKETDKLNKVMKNINSVSGLIDIMTFLMYHLEKEFKFRDFCLLLNEEEDKRFITFSYTSPRNTPEEREYFMNRKIFHDGLYGVFALALEEKKLIFVEKEDIKQEDIVAQEWIEKGRFDYLLLMPLVIYGELVGILFLHSPKKDLTVTKEILNKLEKFSELIAGSIFNAKLLKRIEEASEQANIEKKIAQLAQMEAEQERQKSEKLLLNILPKDVARELKEKGFAEPELYENVSVMFTDFKGFTQIAEGLTPQELIKDLDACFVQFDKITERVGLEKLKTIGDSYMCAGGIPRRNKTHAIDCAIAALEIQSFMNMMKELKESMGFPYWELRLGIHSGPLIAGVIGERKFAYDVWGDTVNTASRMESSGTPGKINISLSTYELVKDLFDCDYRGEVSAKNKGMIKMYYLNRIKPEFSKDENGYIPNGKFWEHYSNRM